MGAKMLRDLFLTDSLDQWLESCIFFLPLVPLAETVICSSYHRGCQCLVREDPIALWEVGNRDGGNTGKSYEYIEQWLVTAASIDVRPSSVK